MHSRSTGSMRNLLISSRRPKDGYARHRSASSPRPRCCWRIGSGMRGLCRVLRDLLHASGSAGLYLEDLYTKPHLRGQGNSLGQNCDRTRAAAVWRVLDWNEPAIRFYKKLGAVPMDESTKYRLTLTRVQRSQRESGWFGQPKNLNKNPGR